MGSCGQHPRGAWGRPRLSALLLSVGSKSHWGRERVLQLDQGTTLLASNSKLHACRGATQKRVLVCAVAQKRF